MARPLAFFIYAMFDLHISKRTSEAVYGMGFVGAVIYFISVATGFWDGVLGVLKAIIWPVFFVYEALQFFYTR